MGLEPVTIGVDLGVEVLKKIAPSGIAWVKTKFFGERILAIGEKRAGKSSFINYLEYGVLLPPGTRTGRTLEERDTASFHLAIGRDQSLRMSVRKATDTRGHDSVGEQIDLVMSRRPSILMFFVDAGRNWSQKDDDYGLKYIADAFEELHAKSARRPSIARRLKHICIVLNKIDLITDDQLLREKQDQVKALLQSYKAPNWGGRADDVMVYRCIAIEHEQAISLLERMIKTIMTSVVIQHNHK